MIFSKKKSFVIVIFVLGILIVGYFIMQIYSQKVERTRFFLFKDDFELVNDYILGISVNHNDSSFNIIRDDAGNILSLVAFYDDQITEDVKLIPENTIIDALNNIDENLIIGSFDYIDVTNERIDYAFGDIPYFSRKDLEKCSVLKETAIPNNGNRKLPNAD